VGQDAGVRPATSDRQALVGRHPQLPRLLLFNGFGARGALSIPWFAERFAAYLLQDRRLPAEADIARYAALL
jgi:glycine oxidase